MNNQKSQESLRSKKIFSLLLGVVFLFSLVALVSAANSGGLLQIWRNTTSGTNVSYVDNNGNWFSSGNFNLSGIYYGSGTGLTNLNLSSINSWTKFGNVINEKVYKYEPIKMIDMNPSDLLGSLDEFFQISLFKEDFK